MAAPGSSRNGGRWAGRWRWAVGVTAGLAILVAAVLWGKGALGAPAVGAAKLAALRALKVGYPILGASAMLGGLGFATMLARSRRSRVRRPVAAKGLLLCAGIVFGLALIEAGAGLWLARAHRMPSLSGGLVRPRRASPPPSKYDTETPDERALPEALAGGPEDEIYLVVLGESSAAGLPYAQKTSVGKIVEWQLNWLIPGRRFRVDVLAESGSHLEWQHQKLATLTRRPDGIIVYCGHNEFYSRQGWQHEVDYYHDSPPAPRATMAERASRYSPLVRMIDETIASIQVSLPPEDVPRPLVDAPSHADSERAERLADFRRRLTAIVDYCGRIGALPILVAPPGNDAGFEPNRSILPPETPWARREAFAAGVRSARALAKADPARGIAAYRSLLARQPGFAECHFRLARLLEARGEADGAYRHYVAARDLDGHPLRCLTAFQDVYRELGRRPGAVLIDGQELFRARNPRGQLDDHLFNDGFHPSFEGHVAIAEAILSGLKARGAFGWPATVPAPTIDLYDCASHFGMDREQWKAVCRFASLFYAVTAPIRFDRSERDAKRRMYDEALRGLDAGLAPEALKVPGLGLVPVGKLGRSPRGESED